MTLPAVNLCALHDPRAGFFHDGRVPSGGLESEVGDHDPGEASGV